MLTVDCFRQQARGGCFPDAPRTAEEICVRKTPGGNGISQGRRDVQLTYDILKFHRPPFAGRDDIFGHGLCCGR
jgi:hypothetical protein